MTNEPVSESDRPDLVQELARTLAAVEVDVHPCQSEEGAYETLRKLVGDTTVTVDGWVAASGVLDSARRVDDPWQAGIGVTGVLAASAATGTLALVASPETPRSTSLVPPVHVALVPHSRVLPDLEALFATLARQDPIPSNMQLISGPSRTGDIEMKLVRGVHGPETVHVVLYPDTAPA
ncbi:lactate utilization protein [Spiractinospora alimapuensis]|uniref:LutC/YkgG family protein n=1 Tax=Spiractinospora alimapuensis TaxID=2820884 RepID=UPI001F3FFEC1|nr:lactate utilization protein [Spiractinospora alimapuensis]QVQ50827.1 lactate utilization protein [Spiractinospora alimapuensis]